MAENARGAGSARAPAFLKRAITAVPLAGPLASLVWRRYVRRVFTGRPGRAQIEPYRFHWLPPLANEDCAARGTRQIRNLLNYTKTSGQQYDARHFPAGYHTIDIAGERITGQRDPILRLNKVPFDFSDRSVLDIGCNQGGMLFALADRIEWGVGIDFDRRMINAATRIRRLRRLEHIDFFCHDLESDPFSVITDYLPERGADIVFLLSVCAWINNWRETIRFTAEIADHLLFESNGTAEQQEAQSSQLRAAYREVIQVSSVSDDCPRRKDRKLYLCSSPC